MILSTIDHRPTTVPSKKKNSLRYKNKLTLQEAVVLSPKMRKVGNFTLLGQQPCGGTARGNVHYMATPGSRNFIAWKIVHPSPKGNCTIRLG